MKVLLDTCVLSEIRMADGNPAVKEFVLSIPPENLFISVLTMGEIVKGVERLPQSRKRTVLTEWLDTLRTRFAGRLIQVDADVTEIWGRITARAEQEGQQIPAIDGLLAATALRHDFKIATRNARHFEATRAGFIDPWATA